MKPITKEELIELIGLAELLSEKLKSIGEDFHAERADYTARAIRYKFDQICGEEEMKRIIEQKIKN